MNANTRGKEVFICVYPRLSAAKAHFKIFLSCSALEKKQIFRGVDGRRADSPGLMRDFGIMAGDCAERLANGPDAW